jgi:hypothetical protein
MDKVTLIKGRFRTLAYVAGPYRSKGLCRVAILQNIQRAVAVAAELRRQGMAAIVPHLESLFCEDAISEDGWRKHGLKLLSVCDILVLTSPAGVFESYGTKAEVEFAEQNGIPIFAFDEGMELCQVNFQFSSSMPGGWSWFT